jgi:hypothetical protein
MPADFSTTKLLGMLSAIDRPRRFLLELFFPEEVTFDTEEIGFDKLERARRLAPFVSPLVEGRVQRLRGGEVRTFTPAYVKPKHPITPNALLKRRPGESLNGSLSPEERRSRIIEQTLQDQDDQISRREEWMAARFLLTGKIVVEGEDYPKQEVDFLRASGHTLALTGGDRWGQTGVKVLDSLRTWGATVANASGYNPRVVIMDPLAANLVLADAEIKEILDNRRQAGGQMQFAGAVTAAPGEEVAYLGTVGQFEFYQYQQVYKDEAGVSQKMMPDNTVIMGSPSGVQGVRAYGAIQDLAALRAMSRFPKMWQVNDPSIELLMTQSAPLPVPREPDATLCATVA